MCTELERSIQVRCLPVRGWVTRCHVRWCKAPGLPRSVEEYTGQQACCKPLWTQWSADPGLLRPVHQQHSNLLLLLSLRYSDTTKNTNQECYKVLHGVDMVVIISLPHKGVLGGVFRSNHLASTDNLTRTNKRQNTYKQKLTQLKRSPDNSVFLCGQSWISHHRPVSHKYFKLSKIFLGHSWLFSRT